MPLKRRAIKNFKEFNKPISYRLAENRDDRLTEAQNVVTIGNITHTRNGMSKFNDTSLGGKVLSLSFFKDAAENRRIIAKVGTVLYLVNSTGAATSLKTGLTSTTKHRGITMNFGTKSRHIIAIESDGLFSYDGTTFTQLGQAVPAAPTVAASGSGNTLDASDYQVAVTFYSSTLGFETNRGTASATVTVASGEQIDVSAIASTADNGFIDKVRVYFKDVTNDGSWLFWEEINLGTTTSTIDDNASSTQTPPTTHGAVVAGGGKYLTEFNKKLVYAGNNTNQNDVVFSEQNLPDAFDDTSSQVILYAPFEGPVTGLATGLYDGSALDPYLVVFKRNSTHIYSEIGGTARFVPINVKVGCVNHDTIAVRHGNVYFQSTQGWHVIVNGNIVINEDGTAAVLGRGDIDDIFKTKDHFHKLNVSQYTSFFSVYYSNLDQYINFVAEGSETVFHRAYVYEFGIGGFRSYEFKVNFASATIGEDSNGNEEVLLGDTGGWVYTHSAEEARNDIDANDNSLTIPVVVLTSWLENEDLDASFNFREYILRAIASSNDITVRAGVNFDLSDLKEFTYSFPDPQSGFVLDVSLLDGDDLLSDGDTPVTARGDINRVGENLLVGLYQDIASADIGLISSQLDLSKNGNNN